MISVTIFRNREEAFIGFRCEGHAGYADAGEDIICAGVSVLVINTINSIACFTNEIFTADSDEETGRIEFTFQKPAEHDGVLYMKSLVLGLQGIQNQYGNEYMSLKFKEV